MSPYNSKLQRILTKLPDFNFTIKYRPGIDNEAADFIYRLSQENEFHNTNCIHNLPKEIKVIEKVDGGGESTLTTEYIAIKEVEEDIRVTRQY